MVEKSTACASVALPRTLVVQELREIRRVNHEGNFLNEIAGRLMLKMGFPEEGQVEPPDIVEALEQIRKDMHIRSRAEIIVFKDAVRIILTRLSTNGSTAQKFTQAINVSNLGKAKVFHIRERRRR